MKEVDNVLRIFEETKEAIEKGDSAKINTLSNQTMNTASLSQDPDNIAVAVIVYSLSKIIERQGYKELRGWKTFYSTYLDSINNIINALKINNEKQLKENLELIRKSIEKLSGKLKIYIQDVFRKASINKASKIHEHGLSSEKTASLLGITMYELANYIGQKNIADIPETLTIDIKTRINTAMEMFR